MPPADDMKGTSSSWTQPGPAWLLGHPEEQRVSTGQLWGALNPAGLHVSPAAGGCLGRKWRHMSPAPQQTSQRAQSTCKPRGSVCRRERPGRRRRGGHLFMCGPMCCHGLSAQVIPIQVHWLPSGQPAGSAPGNGWEGCWRHSQVPSCSWLDTPCRPRGSLWSAE